MTHDSAPNPLRLHNHRLQSSRRLPRPKRIIRYLSREFPRQFRSRRLSGMPFHQDSRRQDDMDVLQDGKWWCLQYDTVCRSTAGSEASVFNDATVFSLVCSTSSIPSSAVVSSTLSSVIVSSTKPAVTSWSIRYDSIANTTRTVRSLEHQT